MLSRIVALTRVVDGGSAPMVAPAVYGDSDGNLIQAADCGLEGIACVDDAARALILFADLSSATSCSIAWVRDLAGGYLNFLLYMQNSDGLFRNFIYDWSGACNETGLTSRPEAGSWWQARGTLGLAKAWATFGEAHVELALKSAFATIESSTGITSDLRSLHIAAALEIWNAPNGPDLSQLVSEWCDELTEVQRDGVLLNAE